MQLTAASLYGTGPTPTPPVQPNGQAVADRTTRGNGKPQPNGTDKRAPSNGDRAVLVLVALIGVAIVMGWLSVYAGIRVGE